MKLLLTKHFRTEVNDEQLVPVVTASISGISNGLWEHLQTALEKAAEIEPSFRAVRLFLRTRAIIKFFLRAVSTLENTDGEQRAQVKFCEHF